MTPEEVYAKISPIEGWFDQDNVRVLSELKLPPHPVIVETGTYKGRSTTALSLIFPDSVIYTCDPNTIPTDLPPGTTFYYGPGRYMEVPENIDLLFIDDSHNYEDIKENFERFTPCLNKGGYVVFHDYHFPTAPGVKEFVDELGNCRIDSGGEYGMAIWQKEN